MSVELFGRDFYFLADERQMEKAFNMLSHYILKPQILILLFVFLAYLVLKIVSRYRCKEFNLILKKISLWVYLFVIVSITILNRDAGVRELRLYHDLWFTATGFHESNVLGFIFNTFLYLPLGYLLYRWGFRRLRGILTIAAIFFSSFAIEALQYIFAKGVTAIDDFLANIIGGLIGFGIAIIIQRFTDKRHEVM